MGLETHKYLLFIVVSHPHIWGLVDTTVYLIVSLRVIFWSGQMLLHLAHRAYTREAVWWD